jgi:hypothetical protein
MTSRPFLRVYFSNLIWGAVTAEVLAAEEVPNRQNNRIRKRTGKSRRMLIRLFIAILHCRRYGSLDFEAMVTIASGKAWVRLQNAEIRGPERLFVAWI